MPLEVSVKGEQTEAISLSEDGEESEAVGGSPDGGSASRHPHLPDLSTRGRRTYRRMDLVGNVRILDVSRKTGGVLVLGPHWPFAFFMLAIHLAIAAAYFLFLVKVVDGLYVSMLPICICAVIAVIVPTFAFLLTTIKDPGYLLDIHPIDDTTNILDSPATRFRGSEVEFPCYAKILAAHHVWNLFSLRHTCSRLSRFRFRRGGQPLPSTVGLRREETAASVSVELPTCVSHKQSSQPSATQSTSVSNDARDVTVMDSRLPRNLLHIEDNGETMSLRFCDVCKVEVPLEAHHCEDCNLCVDGLDHHCPWTSKCVGAQNLYTFYGWIVSAILGIVFMGLSGALAGASAEIALDHYPNTYL